jgi:hypothetical protein
MDELTQVFGCLDAIEHQVFVLENETSVQSGKAVEAEELIRKYLQLAHNILDSLNLKNKWQPIETAPKDGTKILVGWFIGADGQDISDMQRVSVAQWQDEDESECGVKGWWDAATTAVYGGMIDPQPTHWMPIPKVLK